MGLLKKLSLGIGSVLLIAFIIITVVVNMKVVKTSNKIVESTLNVVQKNQEKSSRLVHDNLNNLIKKLDNSCSTVDKIVLNLYDTSYQTLANSTANQIFPLIENFDFDSANELINKLLESSDSITWIQYSTSAEPEDGDTYTFGEKISGNSKIYQQEIKSDFSFLNIKLQVSMDGLAAVANIQNIFHSIDSDNQKLLAQITDIDKKSREEANQFAHLTAAENNQSLITWIVAIMLTMLCVIVALLALFMKQWVTKPLHEITENLHHSSNKVEGSSSEISSASIRLADGSSSQASALEETSSTLEELSAMTNQNATSTTEAESIMKEVIDTLTTTKEEMSELTQAMSQITDANSETSQINKIIDDIAFQTNLLALNAAVEAARAGEAGAGFAVVSDEVRNLALRAADAAKNSEKVIDSTLGTVSNGAKITAKVNDSFTNLDELLARVKAMIVEIAAASNEQNNGIKQINIAVAGQSEIVQQNSADTDVFANTAKEMNNQTAELDEMVRALTNLLGGGAKYDFGKKQPESPENTGQKLLGE